MFIDTFLEFEDKNKLFEKNVSGFYYWHYLRFNIHGLLFDKKFSSKNSGGSLRLNLGIRKLIRIALNAMSKRPTKKLSKKDVAFFFSSRRIKEGVKYNEILIDEIVPKYPNRSISFEYPNPTTYDHQQPEFTPNLRYLDTLMIKDILLTKFQKKFLKKDMQKLQEEAKYICKLISEEFEVDINEQTIGNLLQTLYLRHKNSKDYLLKILKKVSPKMVVTVNGYNSYNMILFELCKDLDIVSVELQHGLIGKGHVAYNFSRAMDLKSFPDRVFVYSDYWKQTRFPIPSENVVATGFPYLEKKCYEYESIIELKNKESDSKNVLIVSQAGWNELIIPVVKDMLEEIGNRDLMHKFNIIIKLHPNESIKDKEAWEQIGHHENVEIIKTKDKPIHYYLAKAHIMVGIASTTIFEASMFDVDIYVIKNLISLEYIGDDVKEITYVDNGKALMDEIETSAGNYSSLDNKGRFYVFNSLDRITSQIDDAIN